MNIIKKLSIFSIVLFLITSCSLDNRDALQNGSQEFLAGSRSTYLPQSYTAKCNNLTCDRYMYPLNHTINTISSNTYTSVITNGDDCTKCYYNDSHEITWKEAQELKMCTKCGYRSGNNLSVTVISCSKEDTHNDPIPKITGFRKYQPSPDALIDFAVWDPVPSVEKYVVVKYYIGTNYQPVYQTLEITTERVVLYRPTHHTIQSIKAYDNLGKLLAKWGN